MRCPNPQKKKKGGSKVKSSFAGGREREREGLDAIPQPSGIGFGEKKKKKRTSLNLGGGDMPPPEEGPIAIVTGISIVFGAGKVLMHLKSRYQGGKKMEVSPSQETGFFAK